MVRWGHELTVVELIESGVALSFKNGAREEFDGLAGCFEGWSGELMELIHEASEAGERIAPRPIYALPVGHRWEHRRGLTLIGDAAHVMSPFGGDGANLAMLDGVELGLALMREGDWDAAVLRSEVAMLARAEVAAAGAWDAIQETFSEGGLEHTLGMFEGHSG